MFAATLVSVAAMAQEPPEAMNVLKVNGKTVSTRLDEFRKITFSPAEDFMLIHSRNSDATVDVPVGEVRRITFGDYIEDGNPDGIENIEQLANFTVYGTDEINIECSDGIRSVQLFNVSGQLLYTSLTSDEPQHVWFSVSEMPNGVYVVVVESSTTTVSQKIIIQ